MTRRHLFISLVVGLCLLGSSLGSYRPASASDAPLPVVAGAAGPRLTLSATRAVASADGFDAEAVRNMQPTTATSADVDEDGTPDLIAVYGDGTSGRIVVWRGNVDAQYLNAPEAQARLAAGTFSTAPFLSVLAELETATNPEFAAASDFDGDGHIDIAYTHTGATTLSLLAGNGTGAFAAPRDISLPGTVTAFASGNIGQPDGHDDLVVGVTSDDDGPRLAVLRAGNPAFGDAPEIVAVPAPASALVIGRVGDDGPADVLGVSGSELWLLNGVFPHARDARTLDPHAVTRALPFEADAVVIGNFAGSKRRDLAVRATDGSLHILAHLGERDPNLEASDRPPLASLDIDWRLLEHVWSPASPGTSSRILTAARLSAADLDDLVVSNGPDALAVLVNGSEGGTSKTEPAFHPIAEAITPASPATAAVAMRLNGDALADLAILESGTSTPSTIVSSPRATLFVNTVADMGLGSLRQAILDSNLIVGPDSIVFAIPGGGPHVINLMSALPVVNEPTNIDATTQPGFSGTPIVRIHGGAIVGMANGLTIAGGTSVVRGFSITGFPGTGLTGNGVFFPMGSGDMNLVEGNYLGVDTNGTTVIANGGDGVHGEGGSNSHTIGGTVAAARNVITGNANGVAFNSTVGAQVRGNYLGPNATGTAGPGNLATGAKFVGTTACTLGGNTAGHRNVVSANDMEGVVVTSGATGTTIAGNFIGMDATGNSPLSNTTVGVNLSGSNSSTVGGPAPGDRNIITANLGGGVSAPTNSNAIVNNAIGLDANATVSFGNGANGVVIGGMNASFVDNEVAGHGGIAVNVSGLSVSVLSNDIFGNGTCIAASADGITITANFIGQSSVGVAITADVTCTDNTFVQETFPIRVTGAGSSSDLRRNQFVSCGNINIDLNADGPTANDAGDVDAGPNRLQNFPVITSAVAGPGQTVISGTLNSEPGKNYEVNFHSIPTCSVGNAHSNLGAVTVSTDLSGNGMFTFNAPFVPIGSVIIATATDVSIAAPATSEFSGCATVTESADVSVTLVDMPDPVPAGGNLDYTITVSNAGPSVATSLSFTHTTPASATFVSIAPQGGWMCTTPPMGGSGPVTCTAPSMAPASSALFTVTLNVPPSEPGPTLNSSVTVSAATPDPNMVNNSAANATTVVAQADLSIVETDTPDPVAAGSTLTLDATVTNIGPSDAVSGSMSQSVPVGTTFAAFSPAAGWSCMTPPLGGSGTITCTNPAIPAGAVAVFSLTVDVPGNTADGTILTSTATIASATPDPNSTNDSSGTSTTVNSQADLSISLVGTPDPIVAGTALTYAIDVANAGLADAQSVTVSQATPAGTTFAALSAPGGWSCTSPPMGGTGVVSCTAPLLVSGATASFSLTVTVLPGTPDGTTISATATVSSATPDPNSANDTAMDSTTVGVSANLEIASTVEPETVNAGETVTVTVTATNLGPSDAVDLTITTPIPVGMAFESATADGGTCVVPDVGATSGSVVCTWAGATPVGGIRTAEITLRALATLADGAFVSIHSTASSSSVDDDSTNNFTTSSVTIARNADLALSIVTVPDPVGPGSTLVSTLTVTNNGPVAAANVQLVTATPDGTVFSSIETTQGTATTPAAGASGAIVVSLGDMPNGTTAVITIAFIVTADDGASVTLTASVSTLTADPDHENDTDSSQADVAVTALQSDLSTTITLSPPEVVTGSDAVIEIEVTNAGPDPATGVLLTHTLPPGMVLRSVTSTQGTITAPEPGSGGTVRVRIGGMVVGAHVTVRITVQVSALTGSTLFVGAVASSSSSDPEPFNNASLEELGVREGARVVLDWLPPDFDAPVALPPPRSLSITGVGSKVAELAMRGSKLTREPRATLVGYNIYRSNQPGAGPLPANFFTQVPAGTTTVTVPTSPGGSFFVVTSQYDEGESGPTNEASGNVPAAELTQVTVKNSKIVATGTGFSDEVQVFIDGIPFVKAAKVKRDSTRVVQKGTLLTGQSIGSYIASKGGVAIVSFRNSNGGIATHRVGSE